MAYNWEKIFKDKSDMELFNIYKGRTQLSGDAIKFAKKELENRNVDLNNLVSFLGSLKASNYKENIESGKNAVRTALTGAILGINFLAIFIISYYINGVFNIFEIFKVDTVLFIVFVFTLFIIFEFILYTIQKNRLDILKDKHLEEINAETIEKT